jgi:hypothetical protein
MPVLWLLLPQHAVPYGRNASGTAETGITAVKYPDNLYQETLKVSNASGEAGIGLIAVKHPDTVYQ